MQQQGRVIDVMPNAEVCSACRHYTADCKCRSKRVTGWNPIFGNGHFTWVFTAKRLSGKTTLLMELIGKHLVTLGKTQSGKKMPVHKDRQFFQRRIFISPTAHLDNNVNKELFDEVYSTGGDVNTVIMRLEAGGENNPHTLLVIDDIIGLVNIHESSAINRFASRNRHYHVSLILSCQIYLGTISPAVRVNTSHRVFFKIVNLKEREKIEKEVYQFEKYYGMIDWKTKFNFIYIVELEGPRTLFFERFERFLGEE
jgi:hypothetical protein